VPPNTCPLCQNNNADAYGTDGDRVRFDCQVCGSFILTGTLLSVFRAAQYKNDLYKISGMTRAASDREQPLGMGTDTVSDVIKSAQVPQTPFDALDRLLLVVHTHMVSLTGGVKLEDTDYPLIFARDFAEFRDFVNLMENIGWITTKRLPAAWECKISLAGWQHIAELRQVGRVSDQAFVAMWFDQALLPAWAEGIEPALKDAGYNPVRVDRVEYNEKIDDRIIAEIRRSGLVVADFTGDRGGVYYEAGFAQGLGLPVIFSVRKDEIGRVHFDTRQYNHIAWETPAELRERLHDRVIATLGPGRKRSTL
jgi:nucleoside 2-deoxyribosyltransferase